MWKFITLCVIFLIIAASAKPAPDWSSEEFGFGGHGWGSSEERYYPRRDGFGMGESELHVE